MSGVQQGAKRGPYAKRQDVASLDSIKSSTESVHSLAATLGMDLIVAMRKAVRKQRLDAHQNEILLAYLNN